MADAESLADGEKVFEPQTLIEEILVAGNLTPKDEDFESTKAGLSHFFSRLITDGADGQTIDRPMVDALICEIDQRLQVQIDVILHHPKFQKLEAAWRGLKFTVDRVDFRENIRIELLNCSKEDLLMDFEDSPEIPKCGMYLLVYSAEFGTFGGRPFGLIVANYEFGPKPQDMALLANCASVATMSHCPFIAAAAPSFFGLDDFLTVPQLGDVAALFEGPQYVKWQAFRDTDDARYVGLTLPRFLLRLPYAARTVRVAAFDYEEDVSTHQNYLWGSAAFAFATRVADSFARYRWCPNIVGPRAGGTVEDLCLHEYEAMGQLQTKIPTEIVLTERREWEIAEEGFIGLTYRRDSDNACFFSAPSTQKSKSFQNNEDGRKAQLNFKLGTQLPYLFITCRLAHYIKVLQREQIGTWKERQDLERELNKWVMKFVADQEVVSASVRGRRPLRRAKITVSEVAGSAGWYKVDLQVQPHFKYMGASFSLGLVGRLDKD